MESSQINNQSILPSQMRDVISKGIDEMGITQSNPIPQVMAKLAEDPTRMNRLVEQSVPHMTPELMAKAKKMAMSGQAHQMMKQMQRRGFDPHKMKKKINKTPEQVMPKLPPIPCRSAIIVPHRGKKIKIKQIPNNAVSLTINTTLKTETPVRQSISRLAIGPWKDLLLVFYYDEKDGTKNELMSKITDAEIKGEVLIVCPSRDLKVEEFELVCKELL